MARRAGPPVPVLTIGGSDSGGAAGIQADLKTFTTLGVYGMSVVTVVTAQNSERVAAVHALPAGMVAQQIDAVLSDYGAAAIKTGFIGSALLIETIANQLSNYQPGHPPPLVVDPVLVNHRGDAMFATHVTGAYRERLVPLATLVTPNRREAELLTGRAVGTVADMVAAAKALQALGAQSVLVKGGREGDVVVDVLLLPGRGPIYLRTPWIDTTNTHGSGDTLSAAVTAFLAQGVPAIETVRRAQQFTAHALRAAAGWHLGAGHGPLCHW